MNGELKKLVGVVCATAVGGVALILGGAYKAIKDDQKGWSDEKRKFMEMDYDEAVGQVQHMWDLGEKYIKEHPEEEFRAVD